MNSPMKERGTAERLVDRLLSRLRRHLLWDSLLLLCPPVLVFSLAALSLYYSSARMTRSLVLFAGSAAAGLVVLSGFFRLHARGLSPRLAALLLDRKVDGKERFFTLATTDLSVCPVAMVARLRQEAAVLAERLELKRDFPYRLKRSFLNSLIASLSILLLFLVFQTVPIFAPRGQSGDEMAVLAQRLSRVSRFAALAASLEALAARMRDPNLSKEERRVLIQQALARVDRQSAAGSQANGAANELLSQTGNALRGLEQEQEKGQGAGGQKNQMSSEGRGGGQESGKAGQGSGEGAQDAVRGAQGQAGEQGQTDASAPGSGQLKEGQPQNGEKQQGDRRDQLGKDQQGRGKDGGGRERSGESKGGAEESQWGQGSQNPGEDIPRGKPAERFLKPGEQGDARVKGARFVTVQLPEGEMSGEGGVGRSGGKQGIGSTAPVGNLPLRQPDSPEKVPEKQPMPLEYRELIR